MKAIKIVSTNWTNKEPKFKIKQNFCHFTNTREISTQGEVALPFVQLSISFLISCLEKYDFYFLLFQQLSLKFIDNCTSGNAPSPFIEISLPIPIGDRTGLFAPNLERQIVKIFVLKPNKKSLIIMKVCGLGTLVRDTINL